MTQIKKKFIENNAVDGTKILLNNNEYLRARNQANNADVDIARVNGSDELEFKKVPYVDATAAQPSAPKHLVTVEYINDKVIGKHSAKDSVQVLADSNFALTGAGSLTIDGELLGNTTPLTRVVLTGQTDAKQNGIYTYAESGGNYTLTRATDFDEGSAENEVKSGDYFRVVGGSVYSGYEVMLTTPNPIVIGTTNLTFAKYPTTTVYEAGDMLAKSGNEFSVDLASNSGLLSTNPGNAGGQLRVKVDTNLTEKDQTTVIDGSGAVVARKTKKVRRTLSSGDISAQFFDLADVAGQDSIILYVEGSPIQSETVDYNVNYTGGTSSKTRISFAGGLATSGVSELVVGDVVVVHYTAF